MNSQLRDSWLIKRKNGVLTSPQYLIRQQQTDFLYQELLALLLNSLVKFSTIQVPSILILLQVTITLASAHSQWLWNGTNLNGRRTTTTSTTSESTMEMASPSNIATWQRQQLALKTKLVVQSQWPRMVLTACGRVKQPRWRVWQMVRVPLPLQLQLSLLVLLLSLSEKGRRHKAQVFNEMNALIDKC